MKIKPGFAVDIDNDGSNEVFVGDYLGIIHKYDTDEARRLQKEREFPDTINLDFSSVAAADTVSYTGSRLWGGMGEDHISFNWKSDAGLANTAYDDPKYYEDEHGLVAGELPTDKDDK